MARPIFKKILVNDRPDRRAAVFDFDEVLHVGANGWPRVDVDLPALSIVGTIPLLWDLSDLPREYLRQRDARRSFLALFRSGNNTNHLWNFDGQVPSAISFDRRFVDHNGTMEFRLAASIMDLRIRQECFVEAIRVRGKCQFVGGFTPKRNLTSSWNHSVSYARRVFVPSFSPGNMVVEKLAISNESREKSCATLVLAGDAFVSRILYYLGFILMPVRHWNWRVPRASLSLRLDVHRLQRIVDATLSSTLFPSLVGHQGWSPIGLVHDCLSAGADEIDAFMRPGLLEQPPKSVRFRVQMP